MKYISVMHGLLALYLLSSVRDLCLTHVISFYRHNTVSSVYMFLLSLLVFSLGIAVLHSMKKLMCLSDMKMSFYVFFTAVVFVAAITSFHLYFGAKYSPYKLSFIILLIALFLFSGMVKELSTHYHLKVKDLDRFI